ncbi:GntR family transcriptional regulator [Solitalea lacus]|uniref:GntR family transcriptional regulator n=1 Tax=Solitalea lacus TaxID=2911172 RepID=UPI001EDC19E3|nr:GntR family transcriptional regulator [Solitalea lacus]UKJ07550.1 GntR family transcriptional regulator [Solitalea lacus]
MKFRDQQAIYLQIVEFACEQLLLGKWQQGQRIPSVRELAVELEVNPNTVLRAYEILQQEEISINKRGVGFFAADNAIEKIKAYRKEQFIAHELMPFFRNLYLLDIDFEELKAKYEAFKKEYDPTTT